MNMKSPLKRDHCFTACGSFSVSSLHLFAVLCGVAYVAISSVMIWNLLKARDFLALEARVEKSVIAISHIVSPLYALEHQYLLMTFNISATVAEKNQQTFHREQIITEFSNIANLEPSFASILWPLIQRRFDLYELMVSSTNTPTDRMQATVDGFTLSELIDTTRLQTIASLSSNAVPSLAQVGTSIMFQSGGLIILMLMAMALTVLTFNRIGFFFELSEQLDMEKTKAIEACKVKSDFLTVVSHELRTPINAVLGTLQIAVDLIVDHTVMPLLDSALNSTELLLDIINQVLDHRILSEGGLLSLFPEPVLVSDFLSNLHSLLDPIMKVKNIHFTMPIFPPSLAFTTLMVDPIRLQQILMNLLSNSIKNTLWGGSITVETHVVLLSSTPCPSPRLFRPPSLNNINTDDVLVDIELSTMVAVNTEEDISKSVRIRFSVCDTAIASKLVCQTGGRLNVVSKLEIGSTFSFEIDLEVTGASALHSSDVFSSVKMSDSTLTESDTKIASATKIAALGVHQAPIGHYKNGSEDLGSVTLDVLNHAASPAIIVPSNLQTVSPAVPYCLAQVMHVDSLLTGAGLKTHFDSIAPNQKTPSRVTPSSSLLQSNGIVMSDNGKHGSTLLVPPHLSIGDIRVLQLSPPSRDINLKRETPGSGFKRTTPNMASFRQLLAVSSHQQDRITRNKSSTSKSTNAVGVAVATKDPKLASRISFFSPSSTVSLIVIDESSDGGVHDDTSGNKCVNNVDVPSIQRVKSLAKLPQVPMHYTQPQPEIPVIISEMMNLKEPVLPRAVLPNETLPVVAVAEGPRFTRKVSLPANTALARLSLLLPSLVMTPVIVSPSPASDVSLRQCHVLLVEDHPVNQMVAMALLKKLGHSVRLAENGSEAVRNYKESLALAANTTILAACQSKDPLPHRETDFVVETATEPRITFDICLMDISMPVMDGITATLAIRKLECDLKMDTAHALPIVAMTAHTAAEYEAKCEAAGMQDFICKPIHRKELVQKINRHALALN